jgi:CheY-like chemotaxis protein
MAIPTILLADNNEIFLHTTAEYLESKGFRVLCAKDPKAAKRILESEILALALIDYRLTNDIDEADDSGYLLARDALKRSALPRVILTQFDDRIDPVVKCLRQDANGHSAALDFIFKKDGYEKMLEAIRQALGKVNLFLCYAHADSTAVEELYDKLVAAGYAPWMDQRDLVPGENWSLAIRKAIRSSDFFIACISKNSVTRRGFIQKEIKMAWDIWGEKLESDIYLIPARLEECDGLDERFCALQWVDLFRPQGFRDLAVAIQAGLTRRRSA